MRNISQKFPVDDGSTTVVSWCFQQVLLSLLLYRAELASGGDTNSQRACGMAFVIYLCLKQTTTITKH